MRKVLNAAVGLVMAASTLLSLSSAASANAVAGGGYSSSYAGESAFTNVAAGQSGQMSAIFFNDGTQPWTPGVVGLLVCAADKATCNVAANSTYAQNWFSSTVYATVTTTVQPGQNGFFVYNFQVPTNTATGTVTSFYGDVGLIATGTMLRPEGYYQANTVPTPAYTVTVTPDPASVAVGSTQQFTAGGVPTGTAVTWSVTGGCGAITSAGLFVGTAMNSATQPCTVVATTSGGQGAAAVSVYGPATQIGCTITPSTIIANGGVTGGVATANISLLDANGNTVANASLPAINIVDVTPNLATMTPTGSVTPINGVVQVQIATTNVAGTIQVSASAAGVTGCNAQITSTGPGSPTGTFAQFLLSPIGADGVSTSTLQVDIVDKNGTRVTSDNVDQIIVSMPNGAGICNLTQVLAPATGTASGGSAIATVSSGRAQFLVQSTTTPGQCLFTLLTNNSSIAGSSATLQTQIIGTPSKLAVMSNNSSTSVHTVSNTGTCVAGSTSNSNTSCIQVVVAVEDGNGSVVTSDNSSVIAASWDSSTCTGAGGGTPSPASPTATASSGRATFLFTSTGAYNGCSVTFTRTGLSGVSTQVSWNAASATQLGCTFQPNPIYHDGVSTSAGTVAVRDRFGNTLGAGTYQVSFGITSGTGGTSMVTTQNPQTTQNGYATWTVRSGTTIGTDTYTASQYGGTALASGSCSVSVN